MDTALPRPVSHGTKNAMQSLWPVQQPDSQFDPNITHPVGDVASTTDAAHVEYDVFGLPRQAASFKNKRVLMNLDPIGARDRVLAVHRDQFKYQTDRRKLLVHDGCRYGDFPHIAEGLVFEVLDNVHHEFVPNENHITEDGQGIGLDEVLNFQGKLRTRGMIQQVLQLIRLDPSIQVKSSEFDANPYEINVFNGLLNLETQQLTPHDPTQLVTKLAPVSWILAAECSFWEGFINEITCHDEELAAYLHRLCGYCLSGSTQEEVMPILYGSGANGKSLYLGTLRSLLGPGEYALTLNPDSLLNSRTYGISYFHRQVETIRTALTIEANPDSTLNEALFKTLIGGDEFSGRGIGENPVQFRPQVKILMAVNHLPGLVGNDHGIRRRIHVVPFRKRFDGSVKKEKIERQIQAEKSGIFAWMVRGFHEWKKQGLNPPEVVRKATEEYFVSNDHLGEYLSERTVESLGATTTVGDLHKDYETWAKDCGVKPLKKRPLGELLRARGLDQDRTKTVRFWKNIALKTAPKSDKAINPFGMTTPPLSAVGDASSSAGMPQ